MKPQQKIYLKIGVGAVILIALGLAFYFSHTSNSPTPCPADAKLCSDGSYVGRVAPSCNFAACPGTTTCPTDKQQCADGSYVGRVLPTCNFAACPVVGEECVPGVKTCVSQDRYILCLSTHKWSGNLNCPVNMVCSGNGICS